VDTLADNFPVQLQQVPLAHAIQACLLQVSLTSWKQLQKLFKFLHADKAADPTHSSAQPKGLSNPQEQPLCSCVQVQVNSSSQNNYGKLTVIDLSPLLESAAARPTSGFTSAAGTANEDGSNEALRRLTTARVSCRTVKDVKVSSAGKEVATGYKQQQARKHLSDLEKAVQYLAAHQQQGEGESGQQLSALDAGTNMRDSLPSMQEHLMIKNMHV
jgi:hypothetical protein